MYRVSSQPLPYVTSCTVLVKPLPRPCGHSEPWRYARVKRLLSDRSAFVDISRQRTRSGAGRPLGTCRFRRRALRRSKAAPALLPRRLLLRYEAPRLIRKVSKGGGFKTLEHGSLRLCELDPQHGVHVAANRTRGARMLVHAKDAHIVLHGVENVQKRYLCRVLCEPSPSNARLHGDESASALAIHLWAVCPPAPVSRATADAPSPARTRSTSLCRPRGVGRELECWNKGGSSRCNLRQVTAWGSPPLLSRHVSTTCWHTTPSVRLAYA